MLYEDDVIVVNGSGKCYTVLRKNISHVSIEYWQYDSEIEQAMPVYAVHFMNGEQAYVSRSEYDKIKKLLYGEKC